MSLGKIIETLYYKYNPSRISWHVEYPEKPWWDKGFTQAQFEHALVEFYQQASALLYLHIPFCHTQCYFCLCKTVVTVDYRGNVPPYLVGLFAEMDMHNDFRNRHGLKSNITDIHLGGGSPTYLNQADFRLLIQNLKNTVDFNNLKEFSIEIDPRRIKEDMMFFYQEMGINRLSFGVQDFDPEVQKAVNRIQPAWLMERFLKSEIRCLFPHGVNFDIMSGLPCQTVQSFTETMHQLIDFSPDRVSLLTMNIAPEFSPHQNQMPKDKIPSPLETRLIMVRGIEMLEEAGYVRTAYDHFAKKSDSVVSARERGKMTWNFLGSSTGSYEDTLALGMSSYSRLGTNYYAQNIYEVGNWQQTIAEGKFPLFRGCHLNNEDKLRRDAIQTLRSYFSLNYNNMAIRWGIDFESHFASELKKLKELEKDGLVIINPDGLELTELGSYFADFIARVFDGYQPIM